MTHCYTCGQKMGDNETVYPMPIYNLKPEKKQYDVMGRIMCWECFNALASSLNMAIFMIRHKHIALNRGESKSEGGAE